jgi:predicted LPLAT superfamily acyltransferase
VDFLEWLGWRWLRRAFPLVAGLILLAAIANDASRDWLMQRYQHRVERRMEQVARHLPTLKPTAAATPTYVR